MNGQYKASYSLSYGFRQYRRNLCGIVVGTLAGLFLASCSAISIPLGDASGTSDVHAPIDLTGSLGPSTDVDITEGDRKIIALAFSGDGNAAQKSLPMVWTNPDTGNRGTITEITAADPNGNRGCARFITSANTIEGLRNYTGVACPDSFDAWYVTVLEPATPES